MCLFVESIKIKDREIQNITLHNERLNKTRFEALRQTSHIDLRNILTDLPEVTGIYKCRVLYRENIEKIEYIPYTQPNINSIKVIVADNIEYSHKYANRESINSLKKDIAEDDIIIIKNGVVTDCSFTNIAFFDGLLWYTPNTPLLKGTKRELLLRNKVIFERQIKAEDIHSYKSVRLFNAMIEWGEVELSTEHIV